MELLKVTPVKDLSTGKVSPESSLLFGLKIRVFVVNEKGRFPILIDNVFLSDDFLTVEI